MVCNYKGDFVLYFSILYIFEFVYLPYTPCLENSKRHGFIFTASWCFEFDALVKVFDLYKDIFLVRSVHGAIAYVYRLEIWDIDNV